MQLELKIHRWTLSHKIRRILWMVVWNVFGYAGPRFFSSWRVFLLKCFGAKIGRAPLVCGGVRVLMPWNLELADHVAVAEGVNIYNFAPVTIGSNTCLSQGVWLCTGSHDYTRPHMPLTWAPIKIGSECWLTGEVFVAPGVTIGNGSVIGARSVVTKDMPEWMVCGGHPCKPIKPRLLRAL